MKPVVVPGLTNRSKKLLATKGMAMFQLRSDFGVGTNLRMQKQQKQSQGSVNWHK